MIVHVPEGDYIALYAYGSRVYGTAQPHSDYDYVGIQDAPNKGSIQQGIINVKLMGSEHFQRLLDEHRMTALECYFLSPENILKAPEKPWKFRLDKHKLFEAITERSEQDWSKASKRFNSSFDCVSEIERGKKSLFHSIRLLMFGIQIARNSAIVDYGAANQVFEEIMTCPSVLWIDYESEWLEQRKQLLTQFQDLIRIK